MRTLKFILFFILLIEGNIGYSAEWKHPEPVGVDRISPDSVYYLFNKGTSGFLMNGGAYATQAISYKQGLKIQFQKSENEKAKNEYYIYNLLKQRFVFATQTDARVQDGKGVFVDGKLPFGWNITQSDAGAFNIQVAASQTDLYQTDNFLGKNLQKTTYLSGFYYDTDESEHTENCQWIFLTEKEYMRYQAELSRYNEAMRLSDKIQQARVKGVSEDIINEAEKVYRNTDSSEDELTAAITALYKGGLKVFVHPGIIVNQSGIQRMRESILNQDYPVYESFCLLKSSPRVSDNYEMNGPYPYISRDHPDYKYTNNGMTSDFSAAYENTLMWILTDRKSYADKAIQILVAYADNLKGIPESNDRPLLVGLEGIKIIRAIELLKYTGSDISETDILKVENMLKTHFIPVMEQFYNTSPYTNGNWGFIVTMAYMGAAILFDDTEMYDRACDFYLNGHDNGTLTNYVDAETGQLQESGRDQQHSMLALGCMGMICEMGYLQGDSLYELLDNRLRKGFEYVACYNMGYDVPFRTWDDISGKYCNWHSISSQGRGRIRGIFEISYNHYVYRKGLKMPYTEELLLKNRPEGLCNESDCGSLLFCESAPLPVDVELGHMNIDFNSSETNVDDWTPVTSGVTIERESNCMKVNMIQQSDGTYRGDIQRVNRTLIDGRNYPFFALKIKGISKDNLALDTDRGPFGNIGYGKWQILGDDIYYCDMLAEPFGEVQLTDNDIWELSKFAFKVSGVRNNDSYTVEWMKTFRSLTELQDFATGVNRCRDVYLHCWFEHGDLILSTQSVCEDIRLISMDGRRLWYFPYIDNKCVSLHLPSSGCYFLLYSVKGKQYTTKVICY